MRGCREGACGVVPAALLLQGGGMAGPGKLCPGTRAPRHGGLSRSAPRPPHAPMPADLRGHRAKTGTRDGVRMPRPSPALAGLSFVLIKGWQGV